MRIKESIKKIAEILWQPLLFWLLFLAIHSTKELTIDWFNDTLNLYLLCGNLGNMGSSVNTCISRAVVQAINPDT